jgi:hypothetical protein
MQFLQAITILIVFLFSSLLANAGSGSMPFSTLPIEAQASISAALTRNAPGLSWVKLAKLTASDGLKSYEPDLGYAVAISGNTVAVGASGAQIGQTVGAGAVYVFVKPRTGWKNMRQIAKLTASDGTYTAGLGGSVTIGVNTIVAGAPGATVGGNSLQGEAYVFVKPIGGWKDMTETAKLTASDGQGQDLFGDSISISGNTIAIGAEQMARGSGKAYVFVMPAGGWVDMTQTAELTPSHPIVDSIFGNAVAIDGDTVVVGQAYKNHAYVFVKPFGGWTNENEAAELSATDAVTFDQFGFSVAVRGKTVVVGKPSLDYSGGAYLFIEPSGGWTNMTQTAKLSASDGAPNDYFGSSVFTNGNLALVGAMFATVGNTYQKGAAYIFVKPSKGWKTTSKFNQKLIAKDKAASLFGASVSMSGTTAVIGAPYTSVSNNPSQGAAYVFGQQ